MHPLGKSPVIYRRRSTPIAESGAIVEYLVECAMAAGGSRRLPDSPERLRYTYWLHYAEGSAMPPLLLKLIFDRIESGPMPFFVKPIAQGIAQTARKPSFIEPQLKLHLDYMESELGTSEWFAGNEFTAADIQMSFPLEAAAVRARAQSESAAAHGFPRAHPCAARLSPRARARREVRFRQGVMADRRSGTRTAH